MAKKPKQPAEAATPDQPQLPTTQRAYTLRLNGVSKDDHSWRAALWATHEAVNKGAKVFGDWLLTLRGGLDHKLANVADPTERVNIRILLALSWLSVEDSHGAPTRDLRVATGKQSTQTRVAAVLAALADILKARGVTDSDLNSWLRDCTPSLSSNIREDAVWVNRSKAFDAAVAQVGNSLTCNEVWNMLEPFFGSRQAYFEAVKISDDEDDTARAEEKAKDLVQKAGQWLSSRFGTGPGADFTGMAITYDKMKIWADKANPFKSSADALSNLGNALSLADADADAVLKLISGPGYKSATRNLVKKWGNTVDAISPKDLEKFAETAGKDAKASRAKTGGKGRRPYSDVILKHVENACGFTYLQQDGPARHSEFAVMLDHAARRVSMAHSWIKRAEAERRRFAENAAKLATVPQSAAQWLDAYIAGRSESTNAIEPYRIRPRAIEGWAEVVNKWSALEGKSVTEQQELAKDIDETNNDGEARTLIERARISAARQFQDDDNIAKFGDIQLFEKLASQDAQSVWSAGDKPDVQPLKDYVHGHDAKFKQTRFKVPAYRHPDALRHPVFVDFGNSRWNIEYAVHQAANAGKRKPAADEAKWLADDHNLRMGLWTGTAVESIDLRWASRRLNNDLALPRKPEGVPVGRADRLGRAAAGVADVAVNPKSLFALNDWNGRLQAPRDQLDAIAKLEMAGKTTKARTIRDNLKWLATFSAKIECRGPFIDYAAKFADNDPAKPFVSRKGELAIKHEGQDKRGGHAKLILSRLPGLRVLSVDLGHRFAAACVAWQVLSAADFAKAIKGGAIKSGGASKRDLHCHVENIENGKTRKAIYRRIGADALPDGKPHPGPWAKLERQFLIKLQGEEEPARAASNGKGGGPNEVKLVEDLAQALGFNSTDDGEESKTRDVAELMARAMRLATLGLKRHGRFAKIAYALSPGCSGIPVAGGQMRQIKQADADHLAFISKALLDWFALAIDWKWDGAKPRELWNTHIMPIVAELAVPEPVKPGENAEHTTKQQRRRAEHERAQKLEPAAKKIAADKVLARQLSDAFRDLWDAADGKAAQVVCDGANTTVSGAASGWHARLRLLSDWITGRRLPGATNPNWRRNVGGLSLMRIATMRALYQLHKAFSMRPKPDRVQGAPGRFESNEGAGQSILDAMERLREQRIKQTASRIVEAALGFGRHKGTGARPVTRKDEPCHAIVIENLRNYRPDELQTRRENKALMNWASAKVRKYLSEGCQLHGLHWREVSPNYTSRQCSRTGLPGARCDDVTVKEFMTAPWMQKAVQQAKEKGDTVSKLLVNLAEYWMGNQAQWKPSGTPAPTVRIPRKGGDLFVSTKGQVVQADLNAAANIGLRALLDPDWTGRWWYVACSTKDGTPGDKLKGSACFADLTKALKGMEPQAAAAPAESSAGNGKAKKPKQEKGPPRQIINAWRTVSEKAPDLDSWRGYEAYWNWVKAEVAKVLRTQNGLGV